MAWALVLLRLYQARNLIRWILVCFDFRTTGWNHELNAGWIDSPSFDAKTYYEQLITTSSLPTLLKRENELFTGNQLSSYAGLI